MSCAEVGRELPGQEVVGRRIGHAHGHDPVPRAEIGEAHLDGLRVGARVAAEVEALHPRGEPVVSWHLHVRHERASRPAPASAGRRGLGPSRERARDELAPTRRGSAPRAPRCATPARRRRHASDDECHGEAEDGARSQLHLEAKRPLVVAQVGGDAARVEALVVADVVVLEDEARAVRAARGPTSGDHVVIVWSTRQDVPGALRGRVAVRVVGVDAQPDDRVRRDLLDVGRRTSRPRADRRRSRRGRRRRDRGRSCCRRTPRRRPSRGRRASSRGAADRSRAPSG